MGVGRPERSTGVVSRNAKVLPFLRHLNLGEVILFRGVVGITSKDDAKRWVFVGRKPQYSQRCFCWIARLLSVVFALKSGSSTDRRVVLGATFP
jgi:hypothetical protein